MQAQMKAFFGAFTRPALWACLPLCAVGLVLAFLLVWRFRGEWDDRDLLMWAVVLAGSVNVVAVLPLCCWKNFSDLLSNAAGAEKAGVCAFIAIVPGMLFFGSAMQWLAAQVSPSFWFEWNLFFPLAGLVWGMALAGVLHAAVTDRHRGRYLIWAGAICLLLLFGG